ncbi:septum formation family protein [Microbacterium sp. MYb66]|uniref:septum formation family protein n=1 Tax=Microbacterium sp. MYb66 TaxID=1848692 RepID=UPI000CFFC219|nr:septum formation family protein [Microbacterium sp. MYb66]PRA79949.1 hypothetical protein CQ045_12830 [Microbacterium sp. MYb66]
MMTLHPRYALLLAGCAVALSAALAGCSAVETAPGSGSTRASESANATPTSEDPLAPETGDCRNEGSSGLPSDAEVVPCTEPHDEEVFHTITLTGSTFSQEMVDSAITECVGDPFTAFVGVSKAESSLDVYPFTPTSETWDQAGGRVVSCVLFDPAGPVEGSLEGSAR